MRFSEKYGTRWVVGRHPRSQDQAHIGPLLHSLEQMVQDAVAVIPDDSSVEFKEPATKGASSSLYKDLIEMARCEITIALLGQNQTTEAGTISRLSPCPECEGGKVTRLDNPAGYLSGAGNRNG